jgi:hypothetical protein
MHNPHYKSYNGPQADIKNLCAFYDFFLSLPAAYLQYICLECVVSWELCAHRFKSLLLIIYLFGKDAELVSLLAWNCPPLPLCHLSLIETNGLSIVVIRIFYGLKRVHIFECLNLRICIHFSRSCNIWICLARVQGSSHSYFFFIVKEPKY